MSWLSYFKPLEFAKIKSPINGEIKVVEKFGKYAVYVDDAPQSGAEISVMWEKIIKTIKQFHNLTMKQCLILGLGGGDVIKALNKYFPQTSITAVELDPVMREIAFKYFGLNKITTLKIIIDNAISYISKNITNVKYDLIVVDLFIGKFNPVDSRKSKFLQHLKNKLTKTGIILFNSHIQPEVQEEFKVFYNLCKKDFTYHEIIFSYRFNRVLLLS